MDAEAVKPAIGAMDKALAYRDGAAERERALIAALAKRYSADPAADRAALNRDYAEAMAHVAWRTWQLGFRMIRTSSRSTPTR